MHSFPHFTMPSVHAGRFDHAAGGETYRPRAAGTDGHPQIRVAPGGRVVERDLSDLVGDELPEAIDF